ncbi:MAG: Tim44/TimA family putative adaptor protein [Hyphomicrobium aestuarii]|nr:Tim44/TimA family putative adaptor protein [Hyphomicrobium aestuarii]
MPGSFDIYTLIAFVVAIVVVLKLRSILGSDPGPTERRSDRSGDGKRRGPQTGQDGGKVVTLPRREAAVAAASGDVAVADAEQRIRAFAANDAAIADGLVEIYKLDPAFDPGGFVKGASQAYEMIVTAFAEGNRKTLKDLLSKDVYEAFNAEIMARDRRGEIVDQSFVGILKADITEAELKNGTASVTVKFLSQLISATRDRRGTVMAGDPQKIKEVTDVWTFSRDISTPRARQNPNWRLVATQDQ